MSQISDVATVRLLVADYAVTDATGKLTVVGGLVTVLAANPTLQGVTAPFWLAVWVSVPAQYHGATCQVEMVLEDAIGEPVAFGPSGQGSLVRIVQDVTFPKPELPGVYKDRDLGASLPARTQSVIAFSLGLPLPPEKHYTWRVKVDGESRDSWTEHFLVISQPAMQASDI